MAYVDLGWPIGIVAISVVCFTMLDGNVIRQSAIALIYGLVGLRMSLMAVKMLLKGELRQELPRYQYQRRRWQKRNLKHTGLVAQIEVIGQGMYNASFLAFPGFIIATNSQEAIHWAEWLGLGIWLFAYIWESTADLQKSRFIQACKQANIRNAVCNQGLWRYSRHPNYFGQWLGWVGVVVATVPSFFALYAHEHLIIWLALGAGCGFLLYAMYNALVFYSGAVPAEFYSLQKRPDYTAYKAQTNQFFPGPRKN